jgi:hypothetical protein
MKRRAQLQTRGVPAVTTSYEVYFSARQSFGGLSPPQKSVLLKPMMTEIVRNRQQMGVFSHLLTNFHHRYSVRIVVKEPNLWEEVPRPRHKGNTVYCHLSYGIFKIWF